MGNKKRTGCRFLHLPPKKRIGKYYPRKNRLKEEKDQDECPTSSGIQDTLESKSSAIIVKSEDVDIDIKVHDIQLVDENESASPRINNSDQSMFQRSVQETEETGAIRLDNNIVIISTSTDENKLAPNRNVPASAAKCATQNHWKTIVGNTLATFNNQKAHNSSGTAEANSNVINTAELCVLCAKDISKICSKKPVATFVEMILNVTGIDVTQYNILPNSCAACYKSLLAIKKFQKQVTNANILIREKLSHLIKNGATCFEHGSVDTNHDVDHTIINVEPNDMGKMHETKDLAITYPTWGASETTKNSVIKHTNEFLVNYNNIAGKNLNSSSVPIVESNKPNIEGNNCINYTKIVKTSKRKTRDNPDSKIACFICGKVYNKLRYNQHMQIHKEPLACKICGKWLQRSSLRSHMLNHENRYRKPSQKYMCSHCGKTYTQISTLKKHEVIHGEKKYVCYICSKAFHYHKYLERHMRSHSGEKPYACSYCDKTFSIIWNLHQHQRLHTNTKPYKCQLCSAAFRHNVTLKGHLATAHTTNDIGSNSSSNKIETMNAKQKRMQRLSCICAITTATEAPNN